MLIGEQLFRLIRPIDVHRSWYSGGRWYARRTRYNKSLEFSLPIRFMLEHCTRYGNDGRKSQHGVFQKTDSTAQVRRKSLTNRFTFFSWLKHRMRHGKRTTCIQIPFWSKDQEIREVSSLEHLHAWPCTKLEPWKSLWERGTMWTNLKAWSDNNLYQAKVLSARYHGRH